ncbi:hypothetical protein C0992_000411, partial [Termitomyces sp. T32_za158]
MSVIEADSTVLHEHTNGDISTASIIHHEAHDTSIESKETVQPKQELNVDKAGEPVAAIETPGTLASGLDKVPNIQDPVEAGVPPHGDGTLELEKVYGDAEAHTTSDGAVHASGGAGVGAPCAAGKDDTSASTEKSVVPEAKEADSNQRLDLDEKVPAPTETVMEASADIVAPEGSAALSLMPAAAAAPTEEMPPAVEVSKEGPATTSDLALEESTIAQSKPTTIAASTNTADDSASSLAKPVSSSFSEEPSHVHATLPTDVVPEAAVPATISEEAKTEALPMNTPTASAAEHPVESAGTVERGIPASHPVETNAGEEPIHTPDTTDTTRVAAAAAAPEVTDTLPATHIVDGAGGSAAINETLLAKESVDAPLALDVASDTKPATNVVDVVHEVSVADSPVQIPAEPEAMVDTEPVKEPIVESSTFKEEVAPSAAEISTQKPAEPVTKAEIAPSETEVVPAVAEPVKEEVVTPVEATGAPETETAKEPIVVNSVVEEVAPCATEISAPVETTVTSETEVVQEPIVASTVVEDVASPAEETSTQKPGEPVTKAEVVPRETEVVPVHVVPAEPVKEEVVTPPVEATVVPETEAVKEPIVVTSVIEDSAPSAAELSSPVETTVTHTVVENVAPSAAEVSTPVETTVAPETEAVKEPIVASTVVEEVSRPAAEVSTQPVESVTTVDGAPREIEVVPELIVPVAAEPLKEEVVTPPVEATVAPETEAVKEPIVARAVAEEVALLSATQMPVESVTNAELASSEKTTSLEPTAKESVPADSAIVASEHEQSSDTTQGHVPSEPTSEGASTLTEPPAITAVEQSSTAAPTGLPDVDEEPAQVASSTEPSAETLSTPTAVQEVAVEPTTADADVHTSTEVPTQAEESVLSKENAVTEEAIPNHTIPAEAETAKEEVTAIPPFEAPGASEIETVQGSIVELNTAIVEDAPSVVEPIKASAIEPVTSVGDVPSEQIAAPELVTNDDVVSVNDAVVSSEPAQHAVAGIHIPSEPISGDASTLAEAPVAVPIEEVAIAPPAELPVANDQPAEVASSTVLSVGNPSALVAVQESAVTEPAEVVTDVEDSVIKPVASK